MNTTSHVQKISFVAVIAILSFAVGMWPPTSGSSRQPGPEQLLNSPETNSLAPRLLAASGDYFLVRQDRRRCISPLCGGYFVKRVNQSWTPCADGRRMRECYVAEIDWNGQPEIDPAKALLRGDIIARR